jgi:seryl-tRNA synthetase
LGAVAGESFVLDLKLIRKEPDAMQAALARRGAQATLTNVLELDSRRRELLPVLEGIRAQQNDASKQIAAAKQRGEDATPAIEQMQKLATQGRELSDQLNQLEGQLHTALAELPNIPDPSSPDEDTVIREVGETTSKGRDHLELAGDLIDMETAAKVSGSRFAYLKGELVFLEVALIRYALEKLRDAGFQAVIPPVLVREHALFGTGFLPDTEQQIYQLPADDLYLVGTSEVSLASLHAEEILAAEQLPLRYAGFSTCFRREAGAAGKDTRGIFRVHQFDKVEMFVFTSPEESAQELERILSLEEAILSELGIPYRVVNIAVGDLGASAAKKYDCEAWLPGQERYRELTSCSATTDFQARRLNIRYRAPDQKRPQHLHTANGTAIAVGRTIIALLENGQRNDGSIELPEVLVPYGAPRRLTVTFRA